MSRTKSSVVIVSIPGFFAFRSEGSDAFGKEDKTMRYRVAAINKLRREEMAHRGVAPTKNTVSTIHWWFLSLVAVASVSIADAQINLQLPVSGPPDLTVSARIQLSAPIRSGTRIPTMASGKARR